MRLIPPAIALATAAALAALSGACGGGGESGLGPSGGTPAAAIDNNDLRNALSHGTCSGTGVVRYAASPMNVADIGAFIPLGLMIGGHVTPIDHQYLVPLDIGAGRTHYNVYAPFAGHIVQIQPRVKQAGDPGTAPVGTVDYRIVFEGSCTFWVYYDLVTQLEPALLAAGGSALAANQSVNVRIAVTPRQLIGRVGSQTLDLGTINSEITLPGFIVPAHYDPAKNHSMDALDYFDEPLRSQLLALNRRTAPPRGGRLDYDLDGKASGNWFLLGTNGYSGTANGNGAYWSGHLSLAYGHIDPALVIISMGFTDGSSQQWAVKGNAPDPATVDAASGLVKYEVMRAAGDSVRTNLNGAVSGVVLVQVLPGRQLRVEYFPGVTGAELNGFSASARTYER